MFYIKKNFIIFFIPVILFLPKWIFSYNFNLEINFINQIIFDFEDWQYLTLAYNFSNLDFNPSYDPELLNLKYIPIPIYSTIFHAIFLNFFNIYSFLILEFFLIVVFFLIFLNFFKTIGLNKIESLLLALTIFSLPYLINFFQIYEFPYLATIKELYNLRFPRPSVTHLYLFSFFLLLISKNKKNKFDFLDLVLIGSFFSFMWGSYYYNLAISGFLFIIYYFYITNNSNQNYLKYAKDFFLVFITFIIFSIPLILILLNSEPDYLIRVGLINLDFNKKLIILNHLLDKLFSFEFLFAFLFLTILYFFLKMKNVYKIEGISLLYFIFLSAFLSPIIFVILSPTISEVYHFMNMLVALTFFVLLIFISLVIFMFIKNISFYNYLLSFCIIFLIFINIFNNYTLAKSKSLNIDKINFNELFNELENINTNIDDSILTFDARVQTHFILQGYKNFPIVLSVNSPIDDETLENKMIKMFNFYNLDRDVFKNFIENKFHGWRVMNYDIGKTLYMKYQANKLITFQNSKNFSNIELDYIKKSSPFHAQIIMPISEIDRLLYKFDNFFNKQELTPDLVIINLNDEFTKNVQLSKKIYCHKNINSSYRIYYIKKNNPFCS